MSKKSKRATPRKRKLKKPTLSACMIVKNEEELLPQCLESIRDVVDEIIVVDTGSSDRTVEIAKSFGAKVFHHPWENDFSKHRNQSIAYAKGEWILIIDADEVLFSWGRELKEILRNDRIDSIYVRVENVYAQGAGTAWHNAIRLLRNYRGIHYKGRVHNELFGQANPWYSSVVLHHLGYALNRRKEEEKFIRTKVLLEEEIGGDPNSARNHHYLAVSLLGMRRYQEALGEAEIALKLSAGANRGSLFLWTRFVAAVSCINLGRIEEAERLCQEALTIDSCHLDSYYLLSSISYSRPSFEEFLKYSNQYLELLSRAKNDPAQFKDLVANTIDHEWRIRLHRSFVKEIRGNRHDAARERELSLEVCRDKSEYERLLAEFCKGRGKAELPENSDKEGWQGKASVSGEGYQEDAQCGISLCMIVKNEEELLPKCFESVKAHVDEIVIVDTGSTDRTVDIAKSYGARVFIHPWEGHFSKHRNQSIGYATKEWILILDADEFVEARSAEYLRHVLNEKEADSLYLSVRSAFDCSKGEAIHNSIRLFRNNGEIHYEGRVHNRLVGAISSKMLPVTVFHEGYNLTSEKSHEKFLRTTELLKKDIEENTEHPRAYHYLAASFLSEERYHEALEYAYKAIDLAEEQGHSDHLYLWSHFIAGLSSLKLGRSREAEDISLRALEKSAMHLDSHYLLTIVYSQKKRWDKVLHHSREFCALVKTYDENPGQFGLIVHNTSSHRWRIHAHMGIALEGLKDSRGAAREFALAEHHCKDRAELHKVLAGGHLANGNVASSELHFQEAFEITPNDVDLLKVGAGISEKRGDSIREADFLERIIELHGPDEQSLFRLGVIYLGRNQMVEAGGFFDKILTINPVHSEALINLGVIEKRKNNTDKAISCFEKALQGDPFSVEALSNLGYAHYQRGDTVGARNAFERLSKISPKLKDPFLLLSRIHVEKGAFDRAVECCDALLRLLDLDRSIILHSLADLSDKYLEIGEALIQNGEMKAAYWTFETALLLSKDAPQVFERIQALYPTCVSPREQSSLTANTVDITPCRPELVSPS